jgi:hypothetical protein
MPETGIPETAPGRKAEPSEACAYDAETRLSYVSGERSDRAAQVRTERWAAGCSAVGWTLAILDEAVRLGGVHVVGGRPDGRERAECRAQV